MRKFLTLISAAALLATPAFAHARGFDSDFSQTITGPFKLEVVVSEDLAHRANNFPKKRSDRGSSRGRLPSPFSGNGKYGDREIEHLLKDMQEEFARDFAKRDLVLSDTAPILLRVTIDDVKPNRPTFNQLSKDSRLSFQSKSIGGADVFVEIISAGGNVIGTAKYDYYSSFNDGSIIGSGIWTDTERAFSNFSNRLSKKLAAMSTDSS